VRRESPEVREIRRRYRIRIKALQRQLAAAHEHAEKVHGCGVMCHITTIDKFDTPMVTAFAKVVAPGTMHEWTTDTVADRTYGWWWRIPYGWLLSLKRRFTHDPA
jgi:hypothetical protein